MDLAAAASYSTLTLISIVIGCIGAAAFAAAFFWSRLGQAQIELLRGLNDAQELRIKQLEDENKVLSSELKGAQGRIDVLERIVTQADAIASLSQKTDEVLAEVTGLRKELTSGH